MAIITTGNKTFEACDGTAFIDMLENKSTSTLFGFVEISSIAYGSISEHNHS